MSKKRPMPEDFPEHAHDNCVDLTKRYSASFQTVRRWRDELGMPQGMNRKRRVQQYDRTTGQLLAEYESTREAGRRCYISAVAISAAARGFPKRTAAGYRWRYADEKG